MQPLSNSASWSVCSLNHHSVDDLVHLVALAHNCASHTAISVGHGVVSRAGCLVFPVGLALAATVRKFDLIDCFSFRVFGLNLELFAVAVIVQSEWLECFLVRLVREGVGSHST